MRRVAFGIGLGILLAAGGAGPLRGQISIKRSGDAQRAAPLFTGSFAPLEFQLSVAAGLVYATYSSVELVPPGYAGPLVNLHAPINGVTPASRVNLSSNPPIPDGAYTVRFTFPWVNAASEMLMETSAGPASCSLQMETNYASGEQYCEVTVAVAGGNFNVALRLNRGKDAALQRITITRWR